MPVTKHWCMLVMLMKTQSSLCGLFYQLPWQRRTLVCIKLNSVTVRTLDDARSITLWYLGLELEILMFIAYTQKPSVNVHAGVSSGNMFNRYLGVYLHPYFVYASWEGYGENAHLCRLTRASLLGYMICAIISCEFVTFPLVSWVRCGTWLYRFLIFASLLNLPNNISFVPGKFMQKLIRDTCDWTSFSRLSSWLMVDTCN